MDYNLWWFQKSVKSMHSSLKFIRIKVLKSITIDGGKKCAHAYLPPFVCPRPIIMTLYITSSDDKRQPKSDL